MSELKISTTVNLGNKEKELLTKRINYIKTEVQYLIDKKKKLDLKNDTILLSDIDTLKQEKINELEKLNKQLLQIHKQERVEQKKIYEMKSIARTLDSLEYRSAQKKNSYEAIQLAKEAKESRDKARDKYKDYLEYEKIYLKYDPEDLPGFLFLHETVIDKYGLCPYIKIDINDTNITCEKIKSDRENWLRSQQDKGNLVYDLQNTIIFKRDFNMEKNKMIKCEIEIEKLIDDILTDNYLDLWQKSKDFVVEYSNAPIKTKKIKELFKNFISDISIIYSETGLPIHNYLSCKYKNIIFHVNELKSNGLHIDKVLIDRYKKLLEDYTKQKDVVEQTTKYLLNTLQNLKNEMYLYLTDQKKFNTIKNINITQKGKYFKKWTVLSEEEKMERIFSFVDYYIEKYMVAQNILRLEDKQKMVDNVYKLLSDAYKNKVLVYRDLKWNIGLGIIESVKILKYNKDKSEFYLTKSQNTINASDSNTNVSTSKKSNVKSYISRENDKEVNENILMFLMTVDKNKAEKDIKAECIEHVKTKIGIKKLNNKDKNTIIERFDSIFKVINNKP